MEHYFIAGDTDHLPRDVVESVQSSVKGIDPVVIVRDIVSDSVNGEGCASDPVCHRADTGAEETLACRIDIFGDGPASDNDVRQVPVPVRSEQGHDTASEVGDLHRDVTRAESVEGDRNVVDCRVKCR